MIRVSWVTCVVIIEIAENIRRTHLAAALIVLMVLSFVMFGKLECRAKRNA